MDSNEDKRRPLEEATSGGLSRLEQMAPGSQTPGLYIKTFGCQMNAYDSEKVAMLLGADYQVVDDLSEASVVFFNTCSVRDKAEHKLYSVLGSLKELKEQKPELVVGVGGCVAQQEGAQIIKRSKVVDFVVGTHNLSLVPSLVKNAKQGAAPSVAVDYREDWEFLPEDLSEYPLNLHNGTDRFGPTATSVRALVAIQRGCNKNCAFCVVPRTRGKEVSRALSEIVREVRYKVSRGAREILLLGQTVNSWGRDLSPRLSFASLVQEVAAVDGVKRIRFTSPHPADVREDFLDLYGRVPQLCPNIHLPIQSGSDRILRLMNRNYKIRRYYEIVDSLRQRCPDIALSTDIIVGFPTETQEDFEMTLEAVSKVCYHQSYSFKYSPRPLTKSVEIFGPEDEVAPDVAQARLAQLQDVQEKISERINREYLHKIVEVLVEGPSKNISSLMRGRLDHNVLVEIDGGQPLVGELVKVRVERASAYGLRGIPVAV